MKNFKKALVRLFDKVSFALYGGVSLGLQKTNYGI
jgi:hypothetical protein